MEFYEYWARSKAIPVNGKTVPFVSAVGYSNNSAEDALKVANDRAKSNAHRINNNLPFDYDYSQLPFCEEVIDRFTKDGELVTVVSRVHYGALVLNTTEVFFADIDLPPSRPNQRGWFSFFSKPKTDPKPPGTAIIDNLQSICDRNPGLGFRLYRTAAGFRAMATSRTFKVGDTYTTELLQQLESDKLYTVLCQRQKCFRARLTPKPFRVGLRNPPTRFPFERSTQRDAMNKWTQQYDDACKDFSTCAFVAHIGNTAVHEDVESICQLHDHFACNSDFPLA